MFIINITYKTSLDAIDIHIEDHVKFLNEQYEQGKFLMSGRKNPRTGGIIITKASSLAEVEQIISLDPFKINDLANYEIIEFTPTKTSELLQFLAE